MGPNRLPAAAVVVQPFALDRCAPIVFPANRLPVLQRDEHVGCPPHFHRNSTHTHVPGLTHTHTHTHVRARGGGNRRETESRRSLRFMYRPNRLPAESHIREIKILTIKSFQQQESS
ncbi:uncharacterized protein LOC111042443 [Myzus persicae]|uniref:uncharacterized protein LOC111042443 n=1 Tax=Myzus persicae TaxID=13164 RepID=UPI000B937A96|nr:uncharacterized protein LOC111042443 [Myzus persicae]